MYLVVKTKDFEKSYKRIKLSGKLKKRARDNLVEVIDVLAAGKKLLSKYEDHQLKGELRHYRECHIKGNLLLVYQIHKKELVLILVDIGTHSYFRI